MKKSENILDSSILKHIDTPQPSGDHGSRKGTVIKPSRFKLSNNPSPVRSIVNNFTLPELSEFVMEEYSLMVQQASVMSKNGSQVMIERSGIKVRNEDVFSFQKEDQVSLNIIMIFLEYLNSLQSSYRAENKNSKNRNLFYAIEISPIQNDPKQIKYKVFEPNFRKAWGNSDLIKNFDKIVILLSVDGRWIVSVFHIAKENLFIIDFLSENLSNVASQKLCENVVWIVQKELGDNVKVESLEYYEDTKINYLSDCGLYVLNYAYKCMNTTEIENIVVKFQDKELFRKKLFWLLFKIRDFTKTDDVVVELASLELKDKSSVRRTSSRPKLTQKKTTESSVVDLISFPTQSSDNKILETNMFSEKRDLESSRRLETKILNRMNSSKLMTKAILPLNQIKSEKVIKKNTSMTESIQSIKDSILLSNSPPRKIVAPQPQLSNKDISTIEINPKQLDQILKNLKTDILHKGKIKKNSSSQNLISSSPLIVKERKGQQHPLKMRSKHHVSHDQLGSLGSGLGSEKSVQKFIQNFANLKLPPILEPRKPRPKMVIPPYQLYNPKNFFTPQAVRPDPMEVLMNHYGYPKNYTEYIMTMKNALMKDGKEEEILVESDDSDDYSLFGSGTKEKPSKEKEKVIKLKGELHKLLKSQKEKYLS